MFLIMPVPRAVVEANNAFEVRREWADSDDAIRAEREAAHGQDF